VWYVCVCKNALFRVSGEGNILLGYVHYVWKKQNKNFIKMDREKNNKHTE